MSISELTRVKHFDYQNNDPRKQCGIIEGTQTFTDVLRDVEIISGEFCAYKTLMLKSPTIKDDDVPDEPEEGDPPVIQVDLGGFPLLTRTRSVGGGGVEIVDCGLTFVAHDPYNRPNNRLGKRRSINRLDYNSAGGYEDPNKMTTRITRKATNGYYLWFPDLWGTGTSHTIVGTELPPRKPQVSEDGMFPLSKKGEVNENKIHLGEDEFAYL